jgi:hypothetical protein
MLVIDYQYDKNKGKEVRAMEGITKENSEKPHLIDNYKYYC